MGKTTPCFGMCKPLNEHVIFKSCLDVYGMSFNDCQVTKNDERPLALAFSICIAGRCQAHVACTASCDSWVC